MAHPHDLGPATPAMTNALVEMKLSSRAWLMIHALLRNHPLNGDLAGTRAWLADHIWRELMINHGITVDEDGGSPL